MKSWLIACWPCILFRQNASYFCQNSASMFQNGFISIYIYIYTYVVATIAYSLFRLNLPSVQMQARQLH